MSTETTAQIVAFANHIGNPNKDPMQKAMDRRWIDETGAPTPEGNDLATALLHQIGTRSCFRTS